MTTVAAQSKFFIPNYEIPDVGGPVRPYEFLEPLVESERGVFLPHQRFLQRVMSAQTLYDEMLIYHETGTGKTGCAFAVSEHLLTAYRDFYSRAYVLAKSDSLLMAHLQDLILKYSNGRFLPPDKLHRPDPRMFRKYASSDYTFRTTETFSKLIQNLSDAVLRDKYENSVFIVDEIHNMKADEDGKMYKQLFRLFHLLRNRKILLLSATPMRNDVTELMFIMNLILPLQSQFQLLGHLSSLPDAMEDLRLEITSKIRKRISYYNPSPASQSQRIQTIYHGRAFTSTMAREFNIFPSVMEPFQRDAYLRAFHMDHHRRQGGGSTATASSFYFNSRQAALFVFPDATWGGAGDDRGGRIDPRFISSLKTLSVLARFSKKYAIILRNVTETKGKIIYIFCPIVHGSGLNLLARILEEFGYSPSSGRERIKSKRYIILTSGTDNMHALLAYCNHPRNLHGEYCQIILGSRKISEGFTFKNVQVIHILNFHWNFAETKQAIARGIRRAAHDDLLKELPEHEKLLIDIYQHILLPTEENYAESIDFIMFKICHEKYLQIRQVDAWIAEYSIEQYFKDEAELTEGFFQEAKTNHFLFYDSKSTAKIVSETICALFQRQCQWTWEDIFEHTRPLWQDIRILFETLSSIIDDNVCILNRWNIPSYVREHHNVYFLVLDPTIQDGERCWNELRLNCKMPPCFQTKSMRQCIDENYVKHLHRNREMSLLPKRLQARIRKIHENETELDSSGVPEEILSNPYGYYAMADSKDRLYILKCEEQQFQMAHVQDRRKIKTGANCFEVGFPKTRLAEICIELQIPTLTPLQGLIPKRLEETISGSRALEKWRKNHEWTEEQLHRAIHWFSLTKHRLCEILRAWFEEHRLLVRGKWNSTPNVPGKFLAQWQK